MTTTLSTVVTFEFKANSFNVAVAKQIASQSKHRPSIDKEVTETIIAMINSLFHTTNLSLQQQLKKYKLFYKAFLLIFCLIIFVFIILFVILENNRSSNDSQYQSINLDNDFYFNLPYMALGGAWFLSGFCCVIYNRLYNKLREQWRNECVRNLCSSTAIWSIQFPIIQFADISYPGFMYQDILKSSIKKARKAFKESKKKPKKKKSVLRSPIASPMRGFTSFVSSPAKYGKLDVHVEAEKLNTCKLAFCGCAIKDKWGYVRIFYQYDRRGNDGVKYALNQLQKTNCLINEEEDNNANNVQIVQMVAAEDINGRMKPQQMVSPKANKKNKGKKYEIAASAADIEEEISINLESASDGEEGSD